MSDWHPNDEFAKHIRSIRRIDRLGGGNYERHYKYFVNDKIIMHTDCLTREVFKAWYHGNGGPYGSSSVGDLFDKKAQLVARWNEYLETDDGLITTKFGDTFELLEF